MCRLYILVAHDAGPDCVEAFAEALHAGDVGCAALLSGPDGKVDEALARQLLDIARPRDVALLVENDVALAKHVGADGVHIIGDEAIYETARNELGDEAIVGAGCGVSRHTALALGEAGADYVAIEGSEPVRGEMVAWWAEIVEVPCVAWTPATLDEARELARAGADFVAVEETLWRAAGNPAEAVTALNLALGVQKSAA